MNKEMQEDIKIAYRNFDSKKKEIINLSNKTIKEIDNLNIRIFERLFKKQLKKQLRNRNGNRNMDMHIIRLMHFTML